jgi:ornithine decarboxylase
VPAPEDAGRAQLASILARTSEALEALFPAEDGVEVIAEPGRCLVASSQTLATSVIGRRATRSKEPFSKEPGPLANEDEEQDTRAAYFINDSLYGSFNCVVYDHAAPTAEPLRVRSQARGGSGNGAAAEEERRPSTVFGQTCDGLDVVAGDVALPPLEVGDWIVWPQMGAYTVAAASRFNGFDPPTSVYID